MNDLEFIKDLLGRDMSIRNVEQKYNVTDAVEYYMSVKPKYQDYINDLMEVYNNGH